MRLFVTVPEASANDLFSQRILPQAHVDQTGSYVQSGITLNYEAQLRITQATVDFKATTPASASARLNNVHITGYFQLNSVVVDPHAFGAPNIPLPMIHVPLNPPAQAPIDVTANVMGHITTHPTTLPDAGGALTVPGWAVAASFDVPSLTVNVGAMTAGIGDSVHNAVHDTLKSLHGPFGHQLLPDATINAIADGVKAEVNQLLMASGFTSAANALVNSVIHLIGLFQPSVGVSLFQFPSRLQPIPGVTITVTNIVPTTSETDLTITIDIA
ncbi:MAG TPA: hypothetical protein VKU00_28415 [Chthonomonadaceae bacterium]|nr:hypothetical protein [Chthonomonadaceae bacterium]